jgi:hypothetical protein
LDCIHARRAAAALKLQANKTDRNDARGLAQFVRSGWYAPIAMKSLETHRIRAVLVARDQLVRMITALINKIRGLTKTFGIMIGSGKGGSFDRAVRSAMPNDPMLRDLFSGLLETLSVLRTRRQSFDRQLQRIARADRTCRLLMTTPGVGPLTAIAFAGGRGSFTVSTGEGRWRVSRSDTEALPVRRGQHRRVDLEMRRQAHASASVRSGERDRLPHQGPVAAAELGAVDRSAIRWLESAGRASTKAGDDPLPHDARRRAVRSGASTWMT